MRHLTSQPHASRVRLRAPIHPTDVERLLEASEPEFDEFQAIWNLAGRVALQLPPTELAALVRPTVRRLTAEGALGPLYAMLDAILRYGTAEQLSRLEPADLAPMFSSTRDDIREAGLELVSRWPAPAA